VWLEIGVRPGVETDPCGYTTLLPRQEITPAPYALYAGNSTSDGDWVLSGGDMYSGVSGNVGIGTTSPGRKLDVAGGINAADYYFLNDDVLVYSPDGTGMLYYGWDVDVQRHSMATGGVERLVIDDAGNVGIGITNPQEALDVNGPINTDSVYKIGEYTVLSFDPGPQHNIFTGLDAGLNNTSGSYNTFSGSYAGYYNTTGSWNTFIGTLAGHSNIDGIYNTFMGGSAGYENISGSWNTFVGGNAGYDNTSGSYNTFLGDYTGSSNTTGQRNTYLGYNSGSSNETG
jgi:hypothetical protein